MSKHTTAERPFKVYVVTINGEKHSIQPNRNAVENLFEQMDWSESRQLYENCGDSANFFWVEITCKRDLEACLEDEVSDERFAAWELASRTGKIVEGL